MENRISACLVVHNEEKVIDKCLQSLYGVVDEIIVVHDGDCSDRTLKIARKYNSKIFVVPQYGNAEHYRPFSYEKASYEWILQIDADEFLSDNLRNNIRNVVENSNVDAYMVRWPYTDGKKVLLGYEDETKKLLFRKSNLYFIGITHESPQTYGKIEKRLDLELGHKPSYDPWTLNKLFTKEFRRNEIQAREIVDIDNAPTFNIQDKKDNPLYKYYQDQIKHPYLFALKRYILFDLIKKILRKNWFYVFVLNIRVMIYIYASVLYCAYRISYYKRQKLKNL